MKSLLALAIALASTAAAASSVTEGQKMPDGPVGYESSGHGGIVTVTPHFPGEDCTDGRMYPATTGVLICQKGRLVAASAAGVPTTSSGFFNMKLFRKDKLLIDTSMQLVSGGDTPAKLRQQIGYVKSCSATMGPGKGVASSMEPGYVDVGVTILATTPVSPGAGSGITFAVTNDTLLEMRHIKAGDCTIDLPNVEHVSETFVLDVPPGQPVTRHLGTTDYNFVVTRLGGP